VCLFHTFGHYFNLSQAVVLSKDEAKRPKSMRWPLLRKGSHVHSKASKKLSALLASKLDTARAWELKEAFLHFWT